MWGPSIIGFGQRYYRYASAHEGDMCRAGFSPRAANLALSVGGFAEYKDLLAELGKHKRSKACLYVNKLADVDVAVLEEIVRQSFEATTDVEHGTASWVSGRSDARLMVSMGGVDCRKVRAAVGRVDITLGELPVAGELPRNAFCG